MRAPVKWLKDYVQFEDTPEVMGDRLTMAGIPVEGIERRTIHSSSVSPSSSLPPGNSHKSGSASSCAR